MKYDPEEYETHKNGAMCEARWLRTFDIFLVCWNVRREKLWTKDLTFFLSYQFDNNNILFVILILELCIFTRVEIPSVSINLSTEIVQ